jgi:phenylpyruvate tautomerase PptA (4-oxalocrotonate tautomerase family)
MPLYSVTTQASVLSGEATVKLAGNRTTLHSEYSGVPKNWMKIVFRDRPPGNCFTAGEASPTAAVNVLIGTGRSWDYKRGLLKRLLELLQEATDARNDQIVIGIQEVPPSQAMEIANHHARCRTGLW